MLHFHGLGPGVNARVEVRQLSVPKKSFNGQGRLGQCFIPYNKMKLNELKIVLVVRPDSPQAWQWWEPFAISVRLGCATAKSASLSTPVDAL